MAALVDSMSDTEVAVTVVNLDHTEARTAFVLVRLGPGCGEQIVFGQARYADSPRSPLRWDL